MGRLKSLPHHRAARARARSSGMVRRPRGRSIRAKTTTPSILRTTTPIRRRPQATTILPYVLSRVLFLLGPRWTARARGHHPHLRVPLGYLLGDRQSRLRLPSTISPIRPCPRVAAIQTTLLSGLLGDPNVKAKGVLKIPPFKGSCPPHQCRSSGVPFSTSSSTPKWARCSRCPATGAR